MKIFLFGIARTCLIYCLLVASPVGSVYAQATSAVSETNGKLSVRAGDNNISGIDGTLTFPLTESWGGQLDIGSLSHDVGDTGFVGGHLFWRNPEIGMIGITANKHFSDLGDTAEVGIQLEKFFPQFTVRGVLGTQRFDRNTIEIADTGTDAPSLADIFSYTNKDDSEYFSVKGIWYLDNDIAFSAKSERRLNKNYAGAGIEWQIGFNDVVGYSIFADYLDVEDFGGISTVGIRFYVGKGNNLKMRHRTADPESGIIYEPTSCPAGQHLQQGVYGVHFCSKNETAPPEAIQQILDRAGLGPGSFSFR